MILIKNIECVETERDPAEIISLTHPFDYVPVKINDEPAMMEVSELHELVYGRRFVRPSDGKDIIIGTSNQAATVLGMQYEAWETMETELNILRGSNHSLLRKIESAMQATLFVRIKWLFNGFSL